MPYTFEYDDVFSTTIVSIWDICPELANTLENLEINPNQNAIPTNHAFMGEFYVNCGDYAILIDIDHVAFNITFKDCIEHSTLLRLLS